LEWPFRAPRVWVGAPVSVPWRAVGPRNREKESIMCQTCGCSPCKKCGKPIENKVCSGCKKPADKCSCKAARK
jgi:hypothetical protein